MSATQTVGAISAKNAKIEAGIGSTPTWTDISGEANSIDTPTQVRQTGDTFTGGSDTAIVTSGKREPIDLVCNFVYTEITGEAFELIRAEFEAGNTVQLRWSPKGGNTGNFQFTAAAGTISAFNFPGLDMASANAIPGSMTLRTPKITKAVVA